jgi:serine/threonine protein kinase
MNADVDPQRWEALKRLFERALSLPPAERSAFLGALGGPEERLRGELEALLRAHDLQSAGASPPALEGPGSVIGHYKLLEEIGSGGFGTVYMAQQTEPVSRRVALKIVKPGMDSREVIARFEAEQQALALMEHENIARVFAGGLTGTGRPYFVMELVRGLPITEYCDARRLAMGARLELFRKVCLAVEHAHERGVVHRDIKPSNVLVTERDGEPVPKVIDFGVAKALGQELTQRTLFTGFRHLVGTPEYMSPEQTNLSGVQVDRRSDVYSLGVLLYELLTGTRPFRIAEVIERGFEELMRTIREVEPPKPSTRLGTLGGELDSAAARRLMRATELCRSVRGELDWITMRCLEKDRARRYVTAKALADDVARHLAEQPVEAGPPSVRYRARKFVQRHRTRLGVGGVALASLAAVWAVFVSQRSRSEAARADLQHEIEARLQDQASDRDRMTVLWSKVLTGGSLDSDERERAAQHLERWAQRISAGSVPDADLQMLARLLTEFTVDGRAIATTEAGANLRIVLSNRSPFWLPRIALAYSVHPRMDGRGWTEGKISEIYGAHGGGGSPQYWIPSPTELGDHVLTAEVDVYFVEAMPIESSNPYWQHGSDHPYTRQGERLPDERSVLARCRIELPTFRFTLTDALAAVVRKVSDPELARRTEERIQVRSVELVDSAQGTDYSAWSLTLRFEPQLVPLALELLLEDSSGRKLAGGDLVVDRDGAPTNPTPGYDSERDAYGRWTIYSFYLYLEEPASVPARDEFANPIRVTLRSSERVALAARPPITEYLEFESVSTHETR